VKDGLMTYRCAQCGHEHDGLPDVGASAPDAYLVLPKRDRASLAKLTPDWCRIARPDIPGEEDYFVRGVISIPVLGQDEPFGIGSWVSQSRESFERFALSNEDGGPTFGWLATGLLHYGQCASPLRTEVHFRAGRLRPLIVVTSDHPVAVDQRKGITLARAWEIVHRYLPN
jgi:hypothetical protein